MASGEKRLGAISRRTPLQQKILAAFGVDTASWASVGIRS